MVSPYGVMSFCPSWADCSWVCCHGGTDGGQWPHYWLFTPPLLCDLIRRSRSQSETCRLMGNLTWRGVGRVCKHHLRPQLSGWMEGWMTAFLLSCEMTKNDFHTCCHMCNSFLQKKKIKNLQFSGVSNQWCEGDSTKYSSMSSCKLHFEEDKGTKHLAIKLPLDVVCCPEWLCWL